MKKLLGCLALVLLSTSLLAHAGEIRKPTIWALWVGTQERDACCESNKKVYITAYFSSEASCVYTQRYINPHVQWSKCIPAEYVQPPIVTPDI